MENLNNKKVLTKEEYTKIIRNMGAISMLISVSEGLSMGIGMGVVRSPKECQFIIAKTHDTLIRDLRDLLKEYDIPFEDKLSLPELMKKVIVVEEDN